jgi:hypothetical protein
MFKKGMIFLLVCVLGLLALIACRSGAEIAAVDTAAQVVEDTAASVSEVSDTTVAATAETSAAEALAAIDQTQAVPAVAEDATTVAIALNGDSISADSPGVTVEGSVATITAAGTYSLSGALADGQIVVDTSDEATVTLILNGVDISNSTSASIYVADAEAAVIVLADGSANNLTDGASYVFTNPEEEEPSGTIFSNADLTITGGGALTVTGAYNDAITSDDGLTIAGGAITVSAVDDGLRGKDYLVVQSGTITVSAGGDGLKSDNEDDAALGYVAVAGGVLNVTAAGDAIAAQTDVLITGGEFNLAAGGGSGGAIADDASAKGIKGLANVLIDAGTFTIDTADDAIHSNANVTINGGTFTIATGDDGIHADATVTINGGEIAITESYEGIESAVITINDGNINVVASDDGINVAGGADGSGTMAGPGRGGRPGGDAVTYTGSYYLYIHGGTIVVSSQGDGLDANGAIEMTGGVVLVNGPTNAGNGALDYDGTFNISGGFFVAAGSAGMAQGPSASSTQNSLLINLSGSLSGGTLIHIRDSAGNEILTFAPSKEFQSIAFSSPDLVTGGEYTLYYGGSSTGAATDGLYQGGSYTPGTEYTSFTVSSTVTQMGGGGGGMRP